MTRYSLSHITDQALLRDLETRLADQRGSTASLLATLAEVDARKLYLPAGYSSMYAFCVGHLHMSEDEAYKRIQAARLGRSFPTILPALTEGRIHLSGLLTLAAHLTPENAAGLIEASVHKTRAQIEVLLAERFPRPDFVASIEPIGPVPASTSCPGLVCGRSEQLAPGRVESRGAAVPIAEAPPRITPLAPQRFGMQVTISEQTREKLRRAQELLSHAVPDGDIAQVLDRALDALITKLERERLANTPQPRPGRRTKSARHIPAHVRREVWKRDQGRCTFVSDTGHRCESHTRLEFDHVLPLARGGEATVANLRLRCRPHNQFSAERAFGDSFMAGRRERARLSG
jgi:hypothetical protein